MKPGAGRVHWNLKDLYPHRQALLEHLEELDRGARDFERRYHGRVDTLGPRALANALARLERLQDGLGRASTYAYLHWSTHTDDCARGALLQRVRESCSAIEQRLLFFDLEWCRMPAKRSRRLLESSALARYRHHLERLLEERPHLLSEAEERLLLEKSVTGRRAWNRFFRQLLSSTRFPLGRRRLSEQEVLSRLYAPGREARRQAARALTRGLEARLPELTFIFNVLLAEHHSEDRLRRFPHWLASRNLANEISDKTVRTLVASVRERYPLVARYYRLKRRLLGLTTLYDYDRYAPVEQVSEVFSWKRARSLVVRSYRRFHPRMGEIAEMFFRRRWIDAALDPGKVSGAFSHGVVPSAHPYILLNFTGQARDVQTLAHELGHGIHQYLSRSQGVFHSHTPLTMAETASVFGETLVFERMLERQQDPRARLAMLTRKIDDTIATVFRQVAMNQFEDRAHRARRNRGELSSHDLSRLWTETQAEMFQGSVRLTRGYRIWWSYIPHFLETPGYVYAYAFGELLVLALVALYHERGPSFAEDYLQLLAAGGSKDPQELLEPLGVELGDPAFWQRGLAAIEARIEQAEALAREIL